MSTNWRRLALVATLLVLVKITIVGSAMAGAQDRDFIPVTDAMLENPDPADWLNWRRTLDGWGYSPLDQINTVNVHQLQLVWSWQLGPGSSEPTPLVHDGVMYIANPQNIVQAVDAVTGDRLWQYTREFETEEDETLSRRTRSIAIYGDKIYLNTSDAHIVALDARTGEVVWDHTVADRALGYRYTSGPIVVQGKIVAGMSGCERFKEDVCFISGPRRGDRRGGMAHIDHRASGRPGRRHVGRPPAAVSGGRRLVDSGQLRPANQPDLLVDVAGEAVGPSDARDRWRRALQQQRARARPGDRRA